MLFQFIIYILTCFIYFRISYQCSLTDTQSHGYNEVNHSVYEEFIWPLRLTGNAENLNYSMEHYNVNILRIYRKYCVFFFICMIILIVVSCLYVNFKKKQTFNLKMFTLFPNLETARNMEPFLSNGFHSLIYICFGFGGCFVLLCFFFHFKCEE